jgi:hypothetical protein
MHINKDKIAPKLLKLAMLGAVSFSLAACVLEPAPPPVAVAPPPAVAVAPGPYYGAAPAPYYGATPCCYAYPEYPPYYYGAPAVGVGVVVGGGHGWGWRR